MEIRKFISESIHQYLNEQHVLNETYKLTFNDKQDIEKKIRQEYNKYLSYINDNNEEINRYKRILNYAKDNYNEEDYKVLLNQFGNFLNYDTQTPILFNKFYEKEYNNISNDLIKYKERNAITNFNYKTPKEKELKKLNFIHYLNQLSNDEQKSIKRFLNIVSERVNSGSGESISRVNVRNLFFKTPQSFQKMFSEKPSPYLWRGDYTHPCNDDYDHSDTDYLKMQSFSTNKKTAKDFGFNFNANNIKEYSGSFSLSLFLEYGDVFGSDFGDDEGEVMFFDVIYKCKKFS